MTLQQIKYILTVAEQGSITEAAKSLFISQPSLSNAIKDVETNIGFPIFVRGHSGVSLTTGGMEFLGYARQVAQQMSLLEHKYITNEPSKEYFRVSTQHYSFTADAFAELLQTAEMERYELVLDETKTHQIIEDVKNRFSELGILFISNQNKAIITKDLNDNQLNFHELFSVKPHVFLGESHPLAGLSEIKLNELTPYARINYIQGNYESTFYSEELFSNLPTDRSIKVSDSAAVLNLLIGMDSYIIATGMIPKYVDANALVSVPLAESEIMTLGYITCNDTVLSNLGLSYVHLLKKHSPHIA